jgi:hypothetical protein
LRTKEDLMGWTTCWKCKERFGLDDATEATLRRSGANFCCPWGHQAHFPAGKTEAEKLQEQLDAERRQRQRAEQKIAEKDDELKRAWATANDQHEQAKHERARANGYKGHATRITKRAKAGVCPCCNRTFAQLARHMATKHPQFTPMPPELEVIDGGKAVA